MPLDTSNQIFQSFLIIMAIAAILAVVLSNLATKKGKLKEGLKGAGEENLPLSLAQQLQKLPLPSQEKLEATKSIVQLFDQELQKQLNIKNQELNEKFTKVIEEKDKAVQAVEVQYKTVSEKYEAANKHLRKLGSEKKQTEEIVRSMAEGVIMVNDKGEVLLMNPAAEKLLGVNKGEKVGKSILSDLKEEQLVTLAQGSVGKEEREIILQSRNDATKKVLKASNAIIESEDGKTMGFVSVLSDVTKQKELDELKASFIASVSHELRTPLHSVRESLSLLLDKVGGSLNPQQEKLLTIASNNIERLSRLINDVLDLSKIEAKQLRLRVSTFRINDLITNTIDTFDAWAKSKQVVIESKLPEPIDVDADQDRISQVLTNLIGNALKFTPIGGKITVEAKKKAGATPLIEISVQDTGPGVAKKDFERIFEKFVQLNTPQLQGISGTGLGLAITKEIVLLHGGRIWVESELGKGSRFIFEILQKNISV